MHGPNNAQRIIIVLESNGGCMHRSLNQLLRPKSWHKWDAYHPGIRGSFSERTHRRSARFGGLPCHAHARREGELLFSNPSKEKQGRPTKYGDTIITARFVTAPNAVTSCSYNNVQYCTLQRCPVLSYPRLPFSGVQRHYPSAVRAKRRTRITKAPARAQLWFSFFSPHQNREQICRLIHSLA
jgi:hypothetical protein